MENKNYYVYAHINPLKNEIFYIGKGKNKRGFSKKYRSIWWNKIVNKYGFIVDILESDLTEEEAFEREKWYINRIGRRDLGKGPLVNMTDGGEGATNLSEEIKIKMRKPKSEQHKKKLISSHKGMKGINHSEETKKKMSESRKGNKNPMYGKKTSDETKLKLSIASKGKNIGKKLSEETKLKISVSKKGNKNMLGKPRSIETKNKLSLANKGKNNPQYDTNIYQFEHKELGTKICTKYELRKEFNLDPKCLALLCRNERTHHKGWKMICCVSRTDLLPNKTFTYKKKIYKIICKSQLFF